MAVRSTFQASNHASEWSLPNVRNDQCKREDREPVSTGKHQPENQNAQRSAGSDEPTDLTSPVQRVWSARSLRT
jgi:hypothetical protein